MWSLYLENSKEIAQERLPSEASFRPAAAVAAVKNISSEVSLLSEIYNSQVKLLSQRMLEPSDKM